MKLYSFRNNITNPQQTKKTQSVKDWLRILCDIKSEMESFINGQGSSPFEERCLLFLNPPSDCDSAFFFHWKGSTFHDTVPQTLQNGIDLGKYSIPQTAFDHISIVVGWVPLLDWPELTFHSWYILNRHGLRC
jgi:hypothetical protein